MLISGSASRLNHPFDPPKNWCSFTMPYEQQLRAANSIGASMTRKNITRMDLYAVIHQKIGLSHKESAALVELVIKEIIDCLERGENVKLSSFGSFMVRKKGRRLGRNPKTGREVSIPSRWVMTFKPSDILRQRINSDSSIA
jgi:integration host factor subunit alpha